jgi:hypothetical protein
MKTAYALMLDRCGLSHREAADLHRVRLDTVKSWASRRNPAPDGVIAELRKLYVRLESAAEEAIEKNDPFVMVLGLAADDHEAKALGWPCVGAHAALLGLVAVRATVPVQIVPRGSTVTTPAAAGVRDGGKGMQDADTEA